MKRLLTLTLSIGLAWGQALHFKNNEWNYKDGKYRDVAVISTQFGDMVVEFYPDIAPMHVESFTILAKEGYFDGTTFHRLIPGFVIQGGDPNSKDDNRMNDGTGGRAGKYFGIGRENDPDTWLIPGEFNDKLHVRGTLSMARTHSIPNSASSQFFVCHAAAPQLDKQYTVFAQVIKGLEVIDKIVNANRPKKENPSYQGPDGDNPYEKIEMTVKMMKHSEAIKEPIVYNEYTFEITDLSNSGKFSSAYYTLWIDWNKDGNFSPEWGDWDKSVVLQERKDDFEGEKWKIVETMEIVESPKFSIVVYKNGEVFQNIKTPFDMEVDIPFDRRFFTVEDVNFDGYEDFYFTDYMGMVNISFIIYLYNSTSEKFEINEDYRSITSPRFDIDHQIIKSFTRGNAAYHESEIYIVLNDKLTRISKIIDDVRSNEYEYIIYDGEKEVAVNESLSKVKLNIAFFKTQKFNVIIDLLDNSNYRYASWSASKNLRNTPDLILKNGVKQETENEISYKFKKGEFSYVCIFNKLTSDGQLKVFQNKKELVKQEASVFIVPNEVKPYEGNKHKITLDIKNNLKD
jgi:peptidyl-prolyl cis-trans isomerase B (cyclophilin B)